MIVPTLTLPLPDLADQFIIRRDITLLNNGSFGACPRPVFEAYQRWQRELEAHPGGFFNTIRSLLDAAREPAAAFLGTSPVNVAFVPNATHAVNIIAHSLQLAPGDEVLGTDHEYGAAERAWRFHCAQRGARYCTQPIALPIESAACVVDQLWAGVNERTRVIFISHITSPTALIMPVAAICRRARAQGILTVIDGAHAPGQIDLHLDTLDPDFYFGNFHKWALSPKGSAFLYAHSAVQSLVQPLVVGWGWQADVEGSWIEYVERTGTLDPAAYLAVPEALAFMQHHNWPAVRAACHELAREARERVATLSGLEQICPDSPAWWSQMCAAPLPVERLREPARLWNEFKVEAPLIRHGDQLLVRISVQAYTHPAEIDRLVEALGRMMD